MDQIIEGCKSKPELAVFIAVCYICDTVLEYWLGKTNKIKQNSKLELGLTIVAATAAIFLRRKKEDVSSKEGS